MAGDDPKAVEIADNGIRQAGPLNREDD